MPPPINHHDAQAGPPGAGDRPSPAAVTPSASASPNASDEGLSMSTSHVPRPLQTAVKLASGLRLHRESNEAPSADDLALASEVLPLLEANVDLHPSVIGRLFVLWNAVVAAGADEITDWALDTSMSFGMPRGLSPELAAVLPSPVMVSATVFADGEVSFAVSVDTFEAPLWLSETLDLAAFEQLPEGSLA
jgi:hypothetical protein